MRFRAFGVAGKLSLRRVLSDVLCKNPSAIHVASLPLEKPCVKRELFWQKMDNINSRFDHAGMKKPAQKRPPRLYAPVYLAEWLEALGVAPVELVKAGVISEGYLSLIRNNKRLNPSPGKLMQIGDFLKIKWTDLYRRPPTREALDQLDSVDEITLARIRTRLRR
jgi:hypothetical protein